MIFLQQTGTQSNIQPELDENSEAFVTFHAELWVRNEDHSFTEKSSFRRDDGHWKYYAAEFLEPEL